MVNLCSALVDYLTIFTCTEPTGIVVTVAIKLADFILHKGIFIQLKGFKRGRIRFVFQNKILHHLVYVYCFYLTFVSLQTK